MTVIAEIRMYETKLALNVDSSCIIIIIPCFHGLCFPSSFESLGMCSQLFNASKYDEHHHLSRYAGNLVEWTSVQANLYVCIFSQTLTIGNKVPLLKF